MTFWDTKQFAFPKKPKIQQQHILKTQSNRNELSKYFTEGVEAVVRLVDRGPVGGHAGRDGQPRVESTGEW